jgi:hypothetical protein
MLAVASNASLHRQSTSGKSLRDEHDPSRRFPYPSELADVTSRLLHDVVQGEAVGPASRGRKRCQPLCSPVKESVRPYLIPAGSVGDGNAELRQSLPQVPFLDRPGLPPRLQDLVGGEGTANLHELSSCPECLFRRQRLLRHRLDAFGAVGQRPAQPVARPCLASTTRGVPVTIRVPHATSLPKKRTQLPRPAGAVTPPRAGAVVLPELPRVAICGAGLTRS